MAVDPQLLAYYAAVAQRFAALPEPADMAAQRQRMRDVVAMSPADWTSLADVSELLLPLSDAKLGALMFRSRQPCTAPPPLLVYFHGGGWAVGSPQTHAAICAMLAHDTGCTVVSVDYRLAPEHPFPVPCEDALAALEYLAGQRAALGCRTDRLAVGGDSAGAHLAAQAGLRANLRASQSTGRLVDAQLLIYPAVTPAFGSDSYAAFADGPGLTREEMRAYWALFIGAEALAQGGAHPDSRLNLLAAAPQGIPPDTVMVVAGHDVLRDDGLQYADFLVEHGAQVVCLEASGMTHSFARLQVHSARARQWMERTAAAFRTLLPDT
ncbi:alpha/beta hydrolase [Imbroritus primus]|uniref:alpha/beta hydrolase n=1 Tax=Imbroritus primus TaxID=3058603 RepID=UPI003D161BD5